MNEPWLRIKIHPWTDGGRQGRVLIAHDRLGGRRIFRSVAPSDPPSEAALPARFYVTKPRVEGSMSTKPTTDK
jgi:hypothetical protein